MNFQAIVLSINSLIVPVEQAYELLDFKDYSLEIEEQKHAALSSGNRRFPVWESFNSWNCFERTLALLGTTRIIYDTPKEIPSLRIIGTSRNRVFELSPYDNFNFRAIYRKWDLLTQDSKYVCLLAAELHPLNHTAPEEVWYVKKLKTDKGYWDIDEEPQLDTDY